tara:strand:- start:2018 stop:2221 length:204 start_codon:yes stop_codon:yes gene_type:complete
VKVGDLVRVKDPRPDDGHNVIMSLLHVTEVAKTGISVIVISGPHIGQEFFLPYYNREIIVISSTEKE